MKQEIKQRIEQIKNGEVPHGYKKTKIGIVPNEWEENKLKEVCINFIVPMRDKPKIFDGQIPWCRIEDAEGIYLNNSKTGQYVSEKVVREMNLKIFPTGTVICSCSASIGTYLINTKPLITNQTFIGIVTVDRLKNFYLRYYMETQTNKLIMISNASTIPYISREKFENMRISLPPLEEQQKIIDILSTQEKVIELKEKLLKEKEKQKKYLMQILLTGRKRLKGFNGEWKKVKLKEYLMEISERNKGLKINNVLSVNNKLGFVKQEIQFGKTVASKDLSNYKIIKNNFIAYNPSRINVGSIAIYQGEVQGIVSPMYVVFKTNEMLDSNYFMFFVQSYEFFEKMKSLLSGSVRDSLNFSDLCNMQILLPSLEEQKAIAEILTTADKELKLLQEELEEEKRKKKALMQLLLTGIVRVKV